MRDHQESLAARSSGSAIDAAVTGDKERAPSWTNANPFLRVHLCAVQDEVKEALNASSQVLSHQELGACNSEQCPKMFEEALADEFNDESFVPETEAFPSLHHDFAEVISLPFSKMPGEVTVEHIEKKGSEHKAKLSKVVSRCDQSGNGDGQLDTENEAAQQHNATTHPLLLPVTPTLGLTSPT